MKLLLHSVHGCNSKRFRQFKYSQLDAHKTRTDLGITAPWPQ